MRKGQEDLNELVDLYFNKKLSTTEISKIKGYSINTISRRLRENGHSLRKFSGETCAKHTVNKNYFKQINSADIAYFLGFLYADGYMDETNRGVKITLQEQDSYILELFKKYTDYSGEVRCVFNKQYKKCYYVLQIYDTDFYNNCLTMGLTPRKSNTLKFIDFNIIPKELIHHFMRGYFDGDGCISKSKRNNLHFSLIGTAEFLETYRSILIDKLGINKTKIGYKSGVNTYVLQIGGKEDVKKVFDYLYKDCNDLKLTRKYDKYELYYN